MQSISASTADITDRYAILFSEKSVITAIGKPENKTGTIRIWNSGRKLNIEIPDNEELVNIEIFNMNGIKIWTITSPPISGIALNLNPAMYIVKVKTKGQVKTSKIVIV